MQNDVMWIAVTPDEYEWIISFGTSQADLANRLGVLKDSIAHNYKKSRLVPTGAPHKHRERMRIRKILLDKEA